MITHFFQHTTHEPTESFDDIAVIENPATPPLEEEDTISEDNQNNNNNNNNNNDNTSPDSSPPVEVHVNHSRSAQDINGNKYQGTFFIRAVTRPFRVPMFLRFFLLFLSLCLWLKYGSHFPKSSFIVHCSIQFFRSAVKFSSVCL